MRRALLVNGGQLIAVALGATFLMFVLLRTIPGDPARTVAGPGGAVSAEQQARIRSELGLDDSVFRQYIDWLWAAAHGDLGKSLVLNGSVTDLLSNRVVVTLELGLYSLIFALAVAVPLSIFASRFRSARANGSVRLIGTLGVAVPSFWLALLLIIAFQNVLPTFGYTPIRDGLGEHLKHMLLPTIALGTGLSTLLFETNRASLIGTLNSDYVRTARSFGVPERRVYTRYALRNALLPTVTVVGLEMGALMGGALLVENAFAVPGMGRLLVQGVLSRDYTVVQGCILVLVVVVVSINLLMDVVYSFVDPRVRTQNG